MSGLEESEEIMVEEEGALVDTGADDVCVVIAAGLVVLLIGWSGLLCRDRMKKGMI